MILHRLADKNSHTFVLVHIDLTVLFCHRYAEAVIPTLTALHASSIIDGLHSQCIDGLKRQNRLKKVKERTESDGTKHPPERQFSTESRSSSGEMKTSSIQALFTLSKVGNIVKLSDLLEAYNNHHVYLSIHLFTFFVFRFITAP